MSTEAITPLLTPEVSARLHPATRAALIGAAAVASLPLLDRISGELRWPGRRHSFGVIPATDSNEEKRAWVTLPGLGVQTSEKIAQALHPTLGRSAIVFLRLPHGAPSMAKIGAGFRQMIQTEGYERIGFVGHSMGAVLMARLLPYVPESTKVDRVLFDCSPTGLEDIHGDPRIPRLVSKLGYPGGAITKAIGAALSYQPHPDHPATVTLAQRLREVSKALGPEAGSVMTWVWQMQLLCNTHPADIQKVLAGRLSPDAQLAYLHPEPYERDTVVNISKAHAAWEELAGRQIHRLPVPGASHAGPNQYATWYNQVIASWVEKTAVTLAA